MESDSECIWGVLCPSVNRSSTSGLIPTAVSPPPQLHEEMKDIVSSSHQPLFQETSACSSTLFAHVIRPLVSPYSRASILVASAFHPSYGDKMLDCAETATKFKACIIVRKGLEGEVSNYRRDCITPASCSRCSDIPVKPPVLFGPQLVLLIMCVCTRSEQARSYTGIDIPLLLTWFIIVLATRSIGKCFGQVVL